MLASIRCAALTGWWTILFSLALLALSAQVKAQDIQLAQGDIEQRLADLQAYHHNIVQQRIDLEEQYSLLQGNRLLHQILQEARHSVRDVRAVNLDEELAQLRLELFQRQRQLRNEQLESELRTSFETELAAVEEQITLIVDFIQTQAKVQVESEALEATLAEYLFWTPSNRNMDLAWLVDFPARAAAQLAVIVSELRALGGQLSVQGTGLLIAFILLLAVLLIKRGAIKQRLVKYDNNVKSNQASSPWLIPAALFLNALLVLPASVVILILAQFINAPVSQGIDLDSALNAVAGALFMISLLRQLLQKNGFTTLYFRWGSAQSETIYKFVRALGVVLVPLSFVLAVSSQQSTQIGDDVLGPSILILSSLYLIGLLVFLFTKLPPVYGSLFIHRVVAAALLLLPVTLFFIVIGGYFYTALMLSGYYLATFYLITCWILAEGSVQRAISFGYDKMQERQLKQSVSPEGSEQVDAGEISHLQVLNVERITTEAKEAKGKSQRLARFGLMIFFTFILYQLWSEATMALDYLNTWFLLGGGPDGQSGLSLGGALTALAVAVIGIVLVRNLSGLLDILLFSRMTLQVGTAYAVTSLINYIVISLTVIFFLGSLGVRWDQLQWLAAGLTVGLGFGLQEIFGNFISGLILLFERPIRVGDIITLGDLSGRVSQIRIRATVLTDFDRRDIVIPNKQFITGQFVNWSLSNTITRITVRVGVAYGSDLEKTREILLKIAEDEPRVLNEPAPMALFLTFGASTLDHELRVHVGGLSDRNPTIDAINREIDRRFREAGVEIAFNQIDVHFKNELGIEKHVERIEGDANKSS